MYHNLTAHYNTYWNGNESFKQGVTELDNKLHENYNEILPVFDYGKKVEAQSINPAMDKAIEKASMVIQQHSMEFGGKEYVRWIDDCYMLIGKSYFYKHEYISARRTFNFVISEYPDNSIRYEATLWLAKTYNQMEEYEKSEPLLKSLSEEAALEDVPFKVRQEIPLVMANARIMKEDYTGAIRPLNRAIELNNKRDLVTRLKFILGQIYQQQENLPMASEMYLDVIKRNPPYEMAFQAKINLAKSYDAQSGNSEQIVKTLTKMLKDVKNKEYKDQIYYALAEVALKDDRDSLAIEHLKMSVATSKTNKFQKTISSLKLANIFFERNAYEMAGAYYDTAMQAIPQDFPDIEVIRARADVLGELVDNLVIVQTEDSLQYLAGLTEEERMALIDGIIQKVIEEEQQKMEEEFLAQQNMFGDEGGMDFGVGQEGAWYFYNNNAKSQGYNDFISKWGNRKLEDLWFLSDKKTVSFGDEGDNMMASDTLAGDSTMALVSDPKQPEYYLQNIPLTKEMMDASHQKIRDALFTLGRLYREGLENNERAREAFEDLLQRYPENDYLLKTWYNLYKIHQELENPDKADYYANLVLTEFPETKYAKVILNPNYFEELAEEQNEAGQLYEKTYQAFKDKQYFLVINYGDLAMQKYTDSLLMPKFEYLRALSIGKIEVQDTLVAELRALIQKYPKSEVAPMAKNILNSLEPGVLTEEEQQQQEELQSPFTFEPKTSHFLVIIANQDSVNISALKVRLSDFNQKYFGIRKLDIKSFLFDNKQHIVTVSMFEDQDDVMNYHDVLAADDYVFANLNPKNYFYFAISENNYPILFKEKNAGIYLKFFKKNYLDNN